MPEASQVYAELERLLNIVNRPPAVAPSDLVPDGQAYSVRDPVTGYRTLYVQQRVYDRAFAPWRLSLSRYSVGMRELRRDRRLYPNSR